MFRSYFSDDGIKYNIGRVPIGGTDFSTRKYTYADTKGVPDLSNFDLAPEDIELKVGSGVTCVCVYVYIMHYFII
jgi:glucosylceramidase